MTGHRVAPRPLAAVLAAAASLLTVAGVACGVQLAAGALSGGSEAQAPQGRHAWGVAQDIPTTFGFVAVEHAETKTALPAGTGRHQGLVLARGQALVQASVTITNTTARPQSYAPAQFRLRAAPGTPSLPVRHASVGAGVLQPDAAVDARLSFIAPRDASDRTIEFADPGARTPLVVHLDDATR